MSIKKLTGVVIILGLSIAFFILYDNALDLAQPRKKVEKTPLTEIPKEPEERRIYLTILDCNKDTICIDEVICPDSTLSFEKFPSESHHVISYNEYLKLPYDPLSHCMAAIDRDGYIRQKGDIAYLKKKYGNQTNKNYKFDFVSKIEWCKTNANQISVDIAGWGMGSQEHFEEVEKAKKKNYSFARFHYDFNFNEPTDNVPLERFLESANDSVFKNSSSGDNCYYLTFNAIYQEENDNFWIHDLGIVADLNGDGYADRLLTWYEYNSGGTCAVTKKSKNGLIEFFQIESGKY
jgi:hypothetical protein